ncbi:PIR Superfamily Protein [Plasmodium ovale curtisi]|uniref:PIR Superfamily Protein n=1 Tax=Plasmodium ovale curtisi TaxID=864141 RepID=A0A1A8VKS1_PLAOA|nr:PIR Superfamily Protein [Plasmodium ovale curtisi]
MLNIIPIYNTVDVYLSHKGILDTYANDSHSNYKIYCENIIKTNLNNNLDYMKACIAFLKHSDISKDKDAFSYMNIPCGHLNIWLKEQIKNIPNYKYDVLEFYNTLKSHEFSKPFINDLCDGEINNIDDSLYTDFQFLYNLHYNLNIYRNIFDYNDLTKCDSVTACKTSYESKINNCLTPKSSPLCKGLKSFKEQYNNEMQIKGKCPNIEKKYLSYPEQENRKEQLERTEDEGSIQLISAPQGEDLSEVHPSGYNSFTPLGSFLSPCIRGKTKGWCNNYENDAHLLHNPENGKTDTQNIWYNIQYHSP